MNFNSEVLIPLGFSRAKSSLEMELLSLQTEAAALRQRCGSMSDNQTVTSVVLNALTDFRQAYSSLHTTQLQNAQSELEDLRRERTHLKQLLDSMQNHQLGSMDALKLALRDAELSRDRCRSRSTKAEDALEQLRKEHEDLKFKYEQLNKQLTDIDSTDADLDSCRKEIQQLRNKVIYLERHVVEAEMKLEGEEEENLKLLRGDS